MVKSSLVGSYLSFQQKRLWPFREKNDTQHMQCAVQIEGNLDARLFEQAFQSLLNRHEILRTYFYYLPEESIPMQVISNKRKYFCPVINLACLDALSAENETNACFTVMGEEPFKLNENVPVKAILLRTAVRTHLLLLNLPALCADFSTLQYFNDELFRIYLVLLKGEDYTDEPLQHIDVSEWQNDLVASEDAQKHLDFWRQMDISGVSSMKLGLMREGADLLPPSSAFAPRSVPVVWPHDLLDHLLDLAHTLQIPVDQLLLSCWIILLWRLTSADACLLGVGCDGRVYEELQAALGPYSSLLPLSLSLTPSLSLVQVLARVQSTWNRLLDHQAYFRWEWLPPSQLTFFPFTFSSSNWPARQLSEDLRLSPVRSGGWSEPFHLHCRLSQRATIWQVELEYDPRVLDAQQMEQIACCLSTLTQAALISPHQPISSLPLLPQQEQQRLQSVLRGPAPHRAFVSFSRCFEQQAERFPDQPAVCDERQQWSYQELNAQANRLARHLRQLGVGANTPVGLCLSRSVEMILGLLAVSKAGGCYVPLEPEMPRTRLREIVVDAQVYCMLIQQVYLAGWEAWEGKVCVLEHWQQDEGEQEGSSNLAIESEPQDLAYIVYTSGSTGRPKGVGIRHDSVSYYTRSVLERLQVEPGWHFATVSSLAADLGNTVIFGSLASGGCLHVLSYATVTSGQALVAYLQAHPVDVLKIVPSHLAALLLSVPQGQALLPRRVLICGGEQLTSELVAQIYALRGSCRLFNHYGPTETTIGVVLGEVEEAGEVALGSALAGTQVYVLDAYQQLVPQGMVGELVIGGGGVGVGYVGRAEETAEQFVPDGFGVEEGKRLYRTGDRVCYTPRGRLVYVDRQDRQVKVRGYRVELGEIEAMVRQQAQVQDCVVLLRKEEAFLDQLVAYVVVVPGAKSDASPLQEVLRENLPEYMLPSAFVFLQELPLTANGKVDREKLPAPDQSQDSAPKPLLQPRDEIELQLLHIWEEVLNIQPIDILDDFFALGGHSILAIRLLSKIQVKFEQSIAMFTLFEHPTIAKLAVILRQKAAPPERLSALVSLQPAGSKPPLFCIHPSGGTVYCYNNLTRYLGSDQPLYGLRSFDFRGVGETFHTLEDIAAHYVAAIQTIQPEGPYLLGGWSSGGVVAFEMAQQLQRQQKNVELLALFDSTAPATVLSPSSFNEERAIDDRMIAGIVLSTINVTVTHEFRQLTAEEQLKFAWEQSIELNVIPADTDIDLLRRIIIMQQKNIRLVHSYNAQVYPGKIYFFKATGSQQDLDSDTSPDSASGWEDLVNGGIDIHHIPGKHSQILEEPNIQILAASLKHCIDAINLEGEK